MSKLDGKFLAPCGVDRLRVEVHALGIPAKLLGKLQHRAVSASDIEHASLFGNDEIAKRDIKPIAFNAREQDRKRKQPAQWFSGVISVIEAPGTIGRPEKLGRALKRSRRGWWSRFLGSRMGEVSLVSLADILFERHRVEPQ